MHGLNQIVRMNKEQEEFIAHILSTPLPPEQNLLDVWRDFKRQDVLGQEPTEQIVPTL